MNVKLFFLILVWIALIEPIRTVFLVTAFYAVVNAAKSFILFLRSFVAPSRANGWATSIEIRGRVCIEGWEALISFGLVIELGKVPRFSFNLRENSEKVMKNQQNQHMT